MQDFLPSRPGNYKYFFSVVEFFCERGVVLFRVFAYVGICVGSGSITTEPDRDDPLPIMREP